MLRTILGMLCVTLILAGCSYPREKVSPDSQAAKEFATQKPEVCCFVGMKSLDTISDKGAAKAPDLSGQLADAKRNLASKESENADLKRQLDALKARPTPPDLSSQLAAKESENADLKRQLDALKARPTPPDLSSQLAAKESENADLKRELDALKARPTPPDLSSQLAAKESENADLKRQLDALKARPIPPDLSSQLAAKESENADLKRQLDALKARPTPPDLSSQLAAKENENAELARQLAAMKEARDKQTPEISKTLAEKGSVTLHGIHFDFGKATIKPQSAKDLAAVGHALMNDPSLKLQIQGHTDDVGSDASNLQLSKRRAAAVKEYLAKYFVTEPDRLTTEGLGESKPVADNKTAEGRALNRRVELIKQ